MVMLHIQIIDVETVSFGTIQASQAASIQNICYTFDII